MTAVTDFQARTEELASATEEAVQAAYVALLAGGLSRADAVVKIAAVVNVANAAAVALGDVYVSLAIEELLGGSVPTVGVLPVDDSDRLVKAAHTILYTDTPYETSPELGTSIGEPGRLERLARSEPLASAQRATGEAMSKQPLVEGWVRQFDADPCELCVWWWRTGRVWPKQHPFQSHKGCNCQPRIVLRSNIKQTIYTKRLRRNG